MLIIIIIIICSHYYYFLLNNYTYSVGTMVYMCRRVGVNKPKLYLIP